jgi:hypothetical protein
LPSPISVIVAFGLAPQHVRIALRCRTLNQSASCPLVLTIRAARWRFGVTFRAPRELVVASVAHANADCHRTPLLRFRSLQRNPTATRCSRQPAPNDPASAFLTGSRPARPRTFATMTSNPSRSGVALAVFRSANVNAVMLAVGLVARFCAASKRRFKRLATRLQSSVRAVSGVTGLIALTSDPSHQALPHYIGRSRAIMHRRVP